MIPSNRVSLELMSIEERQNHTCHRCGKTPVKYFIPSLKNKGKQKEAYCNICALIVMSERDTDTSK